MLFGCICCQTDCFLVTYKLSYCYWPIVNYSLISFILAFDAYNWSKPIFTYIGLDLKIIIKESELR